METGGGTLTGGESTLLIIHRHIPPAIRAHTRHVDIIALEFCHHHTISPAHFFPQEFSKDSDGDLHTVINNHLLSTLNAFTLIFPAVYWCLSWGNGRSGCSAGDVAFETLHVHIRLAAVVGYPEPGACTAGGGTGGEGGGDSVGR